MLDITARIERDSINPHTGDRITTMVLKYPRYIHAEFMTHRMFSRNAASSRAIPVAKMLERVMGSPVMPDEWGSNKPGMQAGEPIDAGLTDAAATAWLRARDAAYNSAKELMELGVHKQYANRLIEPWSYIEVVCTATEWNNFYKQRISPLAQPEINALAVAMKEAHDASTPIETEEHRPFVLPTEEDEFEDTVLDAISVARSARVSYLNHETGLVDVDSDLKLFRRLITADPMHASPFEHMAVASTKSMKFANLRGWESARYALDNHLVTSIDWLSTLPDAA